MKKARTKRARPKCPRCKCPTAYYDAGTESWRCTECSWTDKLPPSQTLTRRAQDKSEGT